MHGINGNYSFSFSQSSSYSFSSNAAGKQESLQTSSHSEVTYESNDKKISLESSTQTTDHLIENKHQEQHSTKLGGRKHNHHEHIQRPGFSQRKNSGSAMKMVEKVLEQSYAKLESSVNANFSSKTINSQNSSSPVATYIQVADEKPTAETVSSNILGFIANKAAQVAADGGSQEDVDTVMKQGLAGFKQGFGEAKQQIEALGILDKSVEADIGQTYDLVLKGVEELKQPPLPESTEAVDVASELSDGNIKEDVPTVIPPASKAENTIAEVTTESVTPGIIVKNNESPTAARTAEEIISNPFTDFNYGPQGSQNLSYASYDAFDFQLITQDGDVVTLNFSDVEAYGQQIDFGTGFGHADLNLNENFTTAFYQNTEFSIDVEGELNSDELHAIKDLMEQVKKLAGEFFTGNPQKAFEQALEIGFDASEIAQYSLNMTSIDVIEIETNYEAIANINPFSGDSYPVAAVQEPVNPLKEISSYVEGLLDALKQTQKLGEQELLTDAMRSIEATSKLEIIHDGETHNINGFSKFNEKLLENLSL